MNLNRREFLNYGILGLGGLITLSLLAPAATYFLSPAWKKKEEDWIFLGEAGKIPVDQPTKVEFVQRRKDGWMTVEEKRSAWVVTKDGKSFDVFDPSCTHLGCPYNWNETKREFLCPCHNGVFSMDGAVLAGPPPRPLDRYPNRVENGKLWVFPSAKKEKA